MMLTVFFLLALVPIALPATTIRAQTSGYTISEVDHQVQVMYSGQVVISDVVHVSGQVTDGFTIGFPAKYSANVLKAVAFDSSNIYQSNLGVQLGDHSGFYAASVNFNGKTPSVFTVAFVLSNILTYDNTTNSYTLDFPAYPALTQDLPVCNVNLTFPSPPTDITVIKSDYQVNADNYVTKNLPAYTYSVGSAGFKILAGTLQIMDISRLDRQLTFDPSGGVSASDTYHIVNNAPSTMTTFILNLPLRASNIVVKDEFGSVLTTSLSSLSSQNISVVNATLSTFLSSGQSTIITAYYNLPGATIQGSKYILNDFNFFPNFYYYVDEATLTFNPPEGATIVSPLLSSLDSSASLTRSSFQDTLTINRMGVSYLDYGLPGSNILQFSYSYNPVWVSFRPTFWVSLLAVVGCIAAVFVRRRKPGEEKPKVARAERLPVKEPSPVITSEQTKAVELVTAQRITSENIKEFTDAYEEKKQLNVELRSLDSRAQKGKIPRRQYKVQRRAIEVRLEMLARSTNRLKQIFRSSAGAYSDLARQLDSAESDLTEAEENIRRLELQQSRGEISIETYKKNIADFQKRREKAESTMNGILLRLREKAR